MTEPRTWVGPTAQERLRILRDTTSIAIVGASDKPSRASYFVASYLLSASDYDVYFVNPTLKEVLGHRVYPTLDALPIVPDIVDVFRKITDIPQVLLDAKRVDAKTLWLQLGLWDDQIAADAESAGMNVVMDRCTKIEHARFHGGLHYAGFDTGVLSSKRQKLS